MQILSSCFYFLSFLVVLKIFSFSALSHLPVEFSKKGKKKETSQLAQRLESFALNFTLTLLHTARASLEENWNLMRKDKRGAPKQELLKISSPDRVTRPGGLGVY